MDLTDEELSEALEAAQALVRELEAETTSRVGTCSEPRTVPQVAAVVRLSGPRRYAQSWASDHVKQTMRLRNNIAAEAGLARQEATEVLGALVALIARKKL